WRWPGRAVACEQSACGWTLDMWLLDYLLRQENRRTYFLLRQENRRTCFYLDRRTCFFRQENMRTRGKGEGLLE
ncbi:hypothetical protein, partial [Prevotella sp.]|uniref:hypothetical protein n=1 Tax=Prevotella sp. TaxID=59823 RepID=UPI002E7A3508